MATCKPSDANLLQQVELALQFGKWVLLENVGEQLDLIIPRTRRTSQPRRACVGEVTPVGVVQNPVGYISLGL